MMADMLSTDQREELRRLFDIEPKGLIPKAKYYAKKKVPESIEWTMDFLSTPTNLTELITRFTEYSIARKQGMSVEAAMRHSIETMPFIKRGASRFTRTYFPLVSYLKASYVVGFKSLQELSAKEQRAKWTFVWSGVATAAALALLNMWEDLTESEKNYYRQREASELAQYVHIPGRFLGDERPDSPIYKFRIPEYIGSAQALGMMYAMSISDSTEINKVDLAKAVSANIPQSANPFEWTMSDTSVAASIGRQTYRNAPNLIRPILGVAFGKTTTVSGTRPITPRSLEYFPGEFQYKIGSKGTSSVSKEIADVLQPLGLSPIMVEYLINEYAGRTGRMMMDAVDEKEPKSVFIRSREDYALQGKWYNSFYNELDTTRKYFRVIDDERDPRPAKSSPEYKQWQDNLEQLSTKYAMLETWGDIMKKAYDVREQAVVQDQAMPLSVYDSFDAVVKSFYEQEPLEVTEDKMNVAYKELKRAAKDIKHKDIVFFAYPNIKAKMEKTGIKKKYNKLYSRDYMLGF